MAVPGITDHQTGTSVSAATEISTGIQGMSPSYCKRTFMGWWRDGDLQPIPVIQESPSNDNHAPKQTFINHVGLVSEERMPPLWT